MTAAGRRYTTAVVLAVVALALLGGIHLAAAHQRCGTVWASKSPEARDSAVLAEPQDTALAADPRHQAESTVYHCVSVRDSREGTPGWRWFGWLVAIGCAAAAVALIVSARRESRAEAARTAARVQNAEGRRTTTTADRPSATVAPPWTCPRCQHVNPGPRDWCEACGFPQGGQAPGGSGGGPMAPFQP